MKSSSKPGNQASNSAVQMQFQPRDIEKIASFLGCEISTAEKAAKLIERAIDNTRASRRLRRAVDVRKDLRWLKGAAERFESATKTLDETLLLNSNGLPLVIASYHFGISHTHLIETLETLRKLTAVARTLTIETEAYRKIAHQPPARQAHATPEALVLWPELFWLWQASGQPWDAREASPLYQFVAFIHDCADLAPPPTSTLRSAVDVYNATAKG